MSHSRSNVKFLSESLENIDIEEMRLPKKILDSGKMIWEKTALKRHDPGANHGRSKFEPRFWSTTRTVPAPIRRW